MFLFVGNKDSCPIYACLFINFKCVKESKKFFICKKKKM